MDPSDIERWSWGEERRRKNRRVMSYIDRCKTRIAGGRFIPMGIFGAAMAAGFLDHPTLRHSFSYWEDAGILWHPAIALPLFVICYGAFLWAHSWHARNPPGPDLPEEPVRPKLWIFLGIVLAAVVLAGSLLGLGACAAALVIAAWILAYRLVIGTMWIVYVQIVAPLMLSGILPPALGWPIPNLFAVLLLSGICGAMVLGGTADLLQKDHREIRRDAKKVRKMEELWYAEKG